MEPVEPHEKTVWALVLGKYSEVWRPASKGGGPDFHDTRLKQGKYASEVLSFHGIHYQRIGLPLDRLGVHLSDQDPKAVNPPQLSGR